MTRHVVTPNIVQTHWTLSFSPRRQDTEVYCHPKHLQTYCIWLPDSITAAQCCFLKYLALDSAWIKFQIWYCEKKKTHLLETWGQTFQRHSECKKENSVLMSGLQTKVKWSSSGERKSLKTISRQSIWWWEISVWTKRGQSDYCTWTLSVNWFSRVLVFYLVVHVFLFALVQTFIWEFVQNKCCFFTCQ